MERKMEAYDPDTVDELLLDKPVTVLYVYGTLRTGKADANICKVKGRLYDLGSFPGLHLDDNGGDVILERIETEKPISMFDLYEGYNEDEPKKSLYLRVPFRDGWLYTYNDLMSDTRLIKSGDWIEYATSTNKYSPYGRYNL